MAKILKNFEKVTLIANGDLACLMQSPFANIFANIFIQKQLELGLKISLAYYSLLLINPKQSDGSSDSGEDDEVVDIQWFLEHNTFAVNVRSQGST